MLNYLERHVLNLFFNVYEMNLKNKLDKNKNDFNIIFDEEHIPDKLINIFLKKIGNNISIVLYLSIIYSLGYAEAQEKIKYINYIEFYKENINEINLLDKDFKRLCVYNTIKFLIHKKRNNVKLLELDNVLKKYSELFEHIKELQFIFTINDIEKMIIHKLLEQHNPSNVETFITKVLDTDFFDEDIIRLSLGYINNDIDLKYLKSFIIRNMLLDIYVTHHKIIKSNEKELSKKDFKGIVSTPEFYHIANCLKNNKLNLPKQKQTYNNIVSNYIFCLFDEDYERQCIKEAEKDLELSKINPYYKLR